MNEKIAELTEELSVIQAKLKVLYAQIRLLETKERVALDALHQERAGIYRNDRLIVTLSAHRNLKQRGWASPWPIGDKAQVMSVGETEATVVWCYDGEYQNQVLSGIATAYPHELVREMRAAYEAKANA